MFNLVRRYPFFRKAVVALFVLPMMFAGGSLVSGLAQQNVGEVESFDISRDEFVARYQSLIENARRRYGLEEIPPAFGQQVRQQVQNNLLSEYLMRAAYSDKELSAPDEAVTAEIRRMDEFQDDNGNFSPELFEEHVQEPRQFAERIRLSLNQRVILSAMESFPLHRIRENLAAFRSQRRVVDETVLTVTAAFNIGEADIRRYYQLHQADYALAEEADFEYVVVSLDDYARDIDIGEAEVAAAYKDYLAELAEGRERRLASHLFVGGGGDDEFARAESLAARVLENPDGFAKIAAAESEDAGSAANGGSLGFVLPGDLPPAMDEAVFEMAVGEVRGPLSVPGGFSIVKLDDIVLPEAPPLASVRERLETRARRESVYDDFEEALDNLQELAHVQIGSLLSVAAATNQTVQVARKIHRRKADNISPPFSVSEELLESLFDAAIVKQGENSEAIELEDGVYVFARSTRYQPQGVRGLTEVAPDIAGILRARARIEILNEEKEQGELRLPPDVAWRARITVSLSDDRRGEDDDIAVNAANGEKEDGRNAAIDRVFAVDLSHGFPAYAFVEDVGRVQIFRIVAAREQSPSEGDYDIIDQLVDDSQRRLAGAGYLSHLAQNYDVRFEIPDDVAAEL